MKTPPSGNYQLNEGSDYQTTATGWVNVDASNLSITITTAGGDVLVGFHGVCAPANDQSIFFDIALDNVRQGGDDGVIACRRTSTQSAVTFSFVRLLTGINAGAHSFRLQWRVSGGTGTLYAGAGTAHFDIHSQLWAREVS
ncbi:MAG: hypothetical protein K8L99_15090 [Anaerolineae bacterium]|nr:hypothetical protein [Anaerolineae bacterium]